MSRNTPGYGLSYSGVFLPKKQGKSPCFWHNGRESPIGWISFLFFGIIILYFVRIVIFGTPVCGAI